MSEAVADKETPAPLVVGRYAIFDELAAGGMATVHLARLLTATGDGRTVAIKRLHAQYAADPEFRAMFTDEARLVTRIKHPNCVRTVDVVEDAAGLFLVMEYVHGESLARLMRIAKNRNEAISPERVATLLHGVLRGLHAAHEARGPGGELLHVVHRDVSPQNVIVGVDGIARVLDFGIAKAVGRMQTTREGQIKGKLTYMAPEQIRGQVDRRSDVFAASVVFWEAITGRRLHEGLSDVEIVTRVVRGKFELPSRYNSAVSPELDRIVLRGLAADPKKRYSSAEEMAFDVEGHVALLDRAAIGQWVARLARGTLDKRAAKVARMVAAADALRPPMAAMRMSMPSTPEAFVPMHALAGVVGEPHKTGDEVSEELDSVAPTITPPPRTPPPEASPAASPPEVVASRKTSASQATPSGTALPSGVARRAPRPMLRSPLVLAALAFALLLAIAGAALGGYAFARRGGTQAVRPAPVLEDSREPVLPSGASARPQAGAQGCDPPYVVDEEGKRREKAECVPR